MHVSKRELTLDGTGEHDLLLAQQSLHATLSAEPGFRWAMLLRSTAEPTCLVALSMWLTREAAETGRGELPSAVYEVATARGSMTPCTHAALVEWTIAEADRASFISRWNAEYHRLEDAIGSRLLQDLSEPSHLVGVHVAQTHGPLELALATPGIKNSDASLLAPASVQHFEVVHLTEP